MSSSRRSGSILYYYPSIGWDLSSLIPCVDVKREAVVEPNVAIAVCPLALASTQLSTEPHKARDEAIS